MQLDAILWLFLPVFVAAGSALLAVAIMQARMEVAVSKEREALAEAKATITSNQITLEERLKAAHESTRRKSLEEFIQDIRVEERSYVRESKSMFATRRLVVVQERLFFKNIPLSNWVEHEMLVEEGVDPQEALRAASVFTTKELTVDHRAAASRLLQESLAIQPALTD